MNGRNYDCIYNYADEVKKAHANGHMIMVRKAPNLSPLLSVF